MASRTDGETYLHGYSEEFRRYHGSRTLANDAPFMVPHLRPGLTLLDCGCGPGSITCDLAVAVAPAQVVGIDIAQVQLDYAKELAAHRGIANVRFEVGNIYQLSFPAHSFDLAFAHNLLEHLRDPLRALKEMHRVLKPGGMVGIHDPDLGTWLYDPPTIEPAVQLILRVAEHNGASFFYARHQRRLLREAGFVRTAGYAVAESHGTPERTRMMAQAGVQQLRDPAFVETVLTQGWADELSLIAMVAAMEAWGEDPDAYWAVLAPAAVGWVATSDRQRSGMQHGQRTTAGAT